MKRLLMIAAFVFVIAGSGIAAASTTENGGKNPPPPVAASLYSSFTVSSNYVWSYAFDATGANQLGNDITLANGGGKLSTVVVSMGNFAPV